MIGLYEDACQGKRRAVIRTRREDSVKEHGADKDRFEKETSSAFFAACVRDTTLRAKRKIEWDLWRVEHGVRHTSSRNRQD